MTEKLKELNDKFYELVGDLHQNKGMMSDKMYEYMQSVILEQYATEYRLLAAEGRIDPERKIFAADLKYSYLVPARRRTLFFWRKDKKWNAAALQLMSEASEAADRFFSERVPEDLEEDSSGSDA